MAVAFDAAVDGSEEGGDGTVTFSHTASGSDRAAFVCQSVFTNDFSGDGGKFTASYGGSGMSELWDTGWGPGGSLGGFAGFRLAGIPSGSATVSGVTTATDLYVHWVGVITFTGVDQTTPVGTPQTSVNTGTAPSVTVPSVAADDFVVDCLCTTNNPTITIGANQTLRNSNDSTYPTRDRSSTQDGADGGVMSWSLSSSQDYALGAVAFKAATGGAAVTGALAVTLGALTSTAAGTVAVQGALTKTLGTLTSTAAGTVAVQGAAAVTLGALSSTATGTVAVQGASTVTLGPLTLSASGGQETTAGALAQTLGVLTATATGTVAVAGAVSTTLGTLTLVASGDIEEPLPPEIQGSLSVTLGALVLRVGLYAPVARPGQRFTSRLTEAAGTTRLTDAAGTTRLTASV